MKKLFLFTALTVLCCGSVFAQTSWVAFTSTTPQAADISLIESDNVSVEFSVDVFGIYKTDTTVSNMPFQRINTPGEAVTVTVGEPEMPCIRQLIAIPHCDDVSLTVNVTGTTSFSNYNVYPAPELVEVIHPDSSVSLEESFVYDSIAYQQNQNYPQLAAEIVSTGYLRDQMYAEVFVYPVQFNPVTGNLQVNTSYELTLTFTNPSGPVNENVGIFNNVATNVFLNYVSSGITAKINDRPGHTGSIEWIELTQQSQAAEIVADYLIITDDIFWDPSGQTTDLLKIAQHRAEYNGFDIAIVKVENVIDKFENPQNFPYEKERAIREFIKSVYDGDNANNTYDGKLAYVLLVGGAYTLIDDGIKASKDLNPGALFDDNDPNSVYPSDYYYSCLTSNAGVYDDVGELLIGRFSVYDASQLHNIIKKTLLHEKEFKPESGGSNDTVFFSNNGFLQSSTYLPLYRSFLDGCIQYPYYKKYFSTPELPIVYLDDYIDILNGGCLANFYFGHSLINNYDIFGVPFGQYLTTSYLKENLSNKGKYPFVANFSCHTGVYTGDYVECLAETMTSYSDTCGFLATLASGHAFWLSKGSLPHSPTAIQEIMPIAIWQHQSHILGEFVLESKITSPAEKDNFALNLFGDPALNLMAEGFEVTHDVTIECGTEISSEIFVREGAKLTIPCDISFLENGKITVDYGGTIEITAGTTITGINSENRIYIYGDILFSSGVEGQPIIFTAPENHSWEGLSISNLTSDIVIDQTIVFQNCDFECHANSLSINPALSRNSFENSFFEFSHGSLYLENTDFENTSVLILDPEGYESSLEITGCEFNNSSNVFLSSIFVERYKQYNIHDNTIEFCDGDGITVFNCGGITEYNFPNGITYNEINYTGTSPDLHKGIKVYRSIADIEQNQITNSDYGVVGMNNSIIRIVGDETANQNSGTQQFLGNESFQMHFTNNSFPEEIAYNIIWNGTNTNPLIYNDANPPSGQLFDVEYNCWDSHFNASSDLIPANQYIWNPPWCPGTMKSYMAGTTLSGDKVLYNSAMQHIENGDYVSAESDFKEIVSNYPDTETAKNAVKQLFELESILDNDYQALIAYLDSEPNLQNNNQLGKLSDWIISYCQVELGEYQLAIDWYDSVIDSTNSEADSTFAAIDMGEAALAMGNTTKGGVQCKYNQFIFDNHKDFEINREYLINELLKSQNEDEQIDPDLIEYSESQIAILHQNTPNPFSSTSIIKVEIIKPCFIELDMLDFAGKKVLTLAKANYTSGVYDFEVFTSLLNEGMYFYTLKINGLMYDSKKMVFME